MTSYTQPDFLQNDEKRYLRDILCPCTINIRLNIQRSGKNVKIFFHIFVFSKCSKRQLVPWPKQPISPNTTSRELNDNENVTKKLSAEYWLYTGVINICTVRKRPQRNEKVYLPLEFNFVISYKGWTSF